MTRARTTSGGGVAASGGVAAAVEGDGAVRGGSGARQLPAPAAVVCWLRALGRCAHGSRARWVLKEEPDDDNEYGLYILRRAVCCVHVLCAEVAVCAA